MVMMVVVTMIMMLTINRLYHQSPPFGVSSVFLGWLFQTSSLGRLCRGRRFFSLSPMGFLEVFQSHQGPLHLCIRSCCPLCLEYSPSHPSGKLVSIQESIEMQPFQWSFSWFSWTDACSSSSVFPLPQLPSPIRAYHTCPVFALITFPTRSLRVNNPSYLSMDYSCPISGLDCSVS